MSLSPLQGAAGGVEAAAAADPAPAASHAPAAPAGPPGLPAAHAALEPAGPAVATNADSEVQLPLNDNDFVDTLHAAVVISARSLLCSLLQLLPDKALCMTWVKHKQFSSQMLLVGRRLLHQDCKVSHIPDIPAGDCSMHSMHCSAAVTAMLSKRASGLK